MPVTTEEIHTMATDNQAAIVEIRADLAQIKADQRAMLDLFNTLQGGFKVLQFIGKLAKPIAAIAAAVVAVKTAMSGWRL